jgi:hypothetical protein
LWRGRILSALSLLKMIEVKTELRTKPDFIIIGAQRGGTTSLFEYLRQHPSIKLPSQKETHFFDKEYYQGMDWYQSFFPTLEEKENLIKKTGAFVTGEATPYYMFYPHAPERIKQLQPPVRLIVLLRNPIDRAYSHWKLERSRNMEQLAFEDALFMEQIRLKGKERELIENVLQTSFEHFCYSYIGKGMYYDQLKRWFNYFPQSQFLIIKSEDMFETPHIVYRDVLAFLGLPYHQQSMGFRVHNFSYQKELMNTKTRNKLAKIFQEPNRKLYALLNRDFEWQ